MNFITIRLLPLLFVGVWSASPWGFRFSHRSWTLEHGLSNLARQTGRLVHEAQPPGMEGARPRRVNAIETDLDRDQAAHRGPGRDRRAASASPARSSSPPAGSGTTRVER